MIELKKLAHVLLDPSRRAQVVGDFVTLVDNEVASKKGLTGMGIKAGFKAVKKFKPGIIPQLIADLLPEFIQAIEPFYDEFLAGDQGDIKMFVSSQKDRIADGLLSVTDARAQTSKHKLLVSTYKKLRPLGKAQVMAALPQVGKILSKYGL